MSLGRLQALMLVVLLAALYRNTLGGLLEDWWNDPNYSHGFIVPIFSGYLIWCERGRLRSIAPRGNWIGLPVLVAGLGMLVIGEIGAEYFTTRSSLIVVLAGLVLFQLGMEIFQVVAFPLAFLVFMIPLPALLFNALTFPLQLIAARCAATALELLGIPILLDGNILHLSHYSLGVTEACSGIRSLMSLLMIAVVWAYFAFKTIVPKLIMSISAIPITIAANSIRVIATGFIVQHLGLQYAEGFYHTLLGWLVFLVAFFGLACIHTLIVFAQHFRQKEAD